MDLTVMAETLDALGYITRIFLTKTEASDYLNAEIHGQTVGFGGSMTLEELRLWERLSTHNTVYSHLHGYSLGPEAANAQIYISSVNGIAETGEIILIDGIGNRASSVLYGHKKVYLVIGRNKIAPNYSQAVWRARNIAAPLNAHRKKMATPCAQKGDHCYNCHTMERICRAMVTMWCPMSSMQTEIILINEDLGF